MSDQHAINLMWDNLIRCSGEISLQRDTLDVSIPIDYVLIGLLIEIMAAHQRVEPFLKFFVEVDLLELVLELRDNFDVLHLFTCSC